MIELEQPSVIPTLQPKPTASYESLEYQVLKFSNLSIPDQIASFDIPIGQGSWVHQIRCGFDNKEDIVLLHGYGGFALTFVRLFQKLATRFRVHALDFLGMGLSHRQDFNNEWNHESSIKYFTTAIEAWRKATGVKSFVLAGHSFGAYIGACYAKRHPEEISRLILMSPPGVMFMDERMSQEMMSTLLAQASFGRKLFLNLARTLINRGSTPSSIMGWPFLGSMLLNKIVEGRLKLENQEKKVWEQYYRTISKIKPNSERAFFKIFLFPRFGAHESIEMILTQNKFPFKIEFYYGDSDWMESKTARSISQKLENGNKVSFSRITNSGHQIIFENPLQMANYILQG